MKDTLQIGNPPILLVPPIRLSLNLQLGLPVILMLTLTHRILLRLHQLLIQDQRHLRPCANLQSSQSKKRPYPIGILCAMPPLPLGVKCTLTTSMKSVKRAMTQMYLLNVIWWSRRWTNMGSIEIANRSTSSTGSLVTFVLAETDGLTHGLNQTILPIIGVGTSISQKFVSNDPLLGGILTRARTNHPTMTRAWMTRIPSTHRWKILPLGRFINWLYSLLEHSQHWQGWKQSYLGTIGSCWWRSWTASCSDFWTWRFGPPCQSFGGNYSYASQSSTWYGRYVGPERLKRIYILEWMRIRIWFFPVFWFATFWSCDIRVQGTNKSISLQRSPAKKPRGSEACVWTIWKDVKLLFFRCFFACQLVFMDGFLSSWFEFSAGGQWISFHPLPNEDGGLRLWYRDWSSRRTCNFQFSFLSSMATG